MKQSSSLWQDKFKLQNIVINRLFYKFVQLAIIIFPTTVLGGKEPLPHQIEDIGIHLKDKTLYIHGEFGSINTELKRATIRKAVGDDDSVKAWHWSNVLGGNVSAYQVLEPAAQELNFIYSGVCASMCAELALEAPMLTAEVRPHLPIPVLIIHGTRDSRTNKIIPPEQNRIRKLSKRFKVLSEENAFLALGGRGNIFDELIILPNPDQPRQAQMKLCLPSPLDCKIIWHGPFEDIGISFNENPDTPLPGKPPEKPQKQDFINVRAAGNILVIEGAQNAVTAPNFISEIENKVLTPDGSRAWRWIDFSVENRPEFKPLMSIAKRLPIEISGVCIGLCSDVADIAPKLSLVKKTVYLLGVQPVAPNKGASDKEGKNATEEKQHAAYLWYGLDSILAVQNNTPDSLRSRIKAIVEGTFLYEVSDASNPKSGFFVKVEQDIDRQSEIRFCNPLPNCRSLWKGDSASLGFVR